jgi:hypothetical protein
MINPDDEIPLDDQDDADTEDQRSQNDIHSNGFENDVTYQDADEATDTDGLRQAYDAAESSYTLNLDDDADDLDED